MLFQERTGRCLGEGVKEGDQGDGFPLRSALGDGEGILCFGGPGQLQDLCKNEHIHIIYENILACPASLWILLASWGCRGVRVLRG